jgi:hypothetical protein
MSIDARAIETTMPKPGSANASPATAADGLPFREERVGTAAVTLHPRPSRARPRRAARRHRLADGLERGDLGRCGLVDALLAPDGTQAVEDQGPVPVAERRGQDPDDVALGGSLGAAVGDRRGAERVGEGRLGRRVRLGDRRLGERALDGVVVGSSRRRLRSRGRGGGRRHRLLLRLDGLEEALGLRSLGDLAGRRVDVDAVRALDLALVEEAQADERQRQAPLGLGFGLHQAVGQRLAGQALDGDDAGGLVLATVAGLAAGVDGDEAEVVVLLAPELGDRHAMESAQLVGGVLAGVHRQLAVEVDELEGPVSGLSWRLSQVRQ